MTSPLFNGLCAFPPTPSGADGVVDTDKLGLLVQRLADAGVDSIGLLGSTGLYAYLDPTERARAVDAAVEAAAGRAALMVGVGALRTRWSQNLARQAERAGADGLLLAPMSYMPLTTSEVAQHYRAVAAATGLPICIYNNPHTTNFVFSRRLIGELANLPNIAAIKMPLPSDGDFASELAALAQDPSSRLAVGYSGDWGAAASLLAGGRAWYSVAAGLLPKPALRLTRAAQVGCANDVTIMNAAFEPLWALFRECGSLRVMYEVADQLSIPVGDPPAPLQRVTDVAGRVSHALTVLFDGTDHKRDNRDPTNHRQNPPDRPPPQRHS